MPRAFCTIFLGYPECRKYYYAAINLEGEGREANEEGDEEGRMRTGRMGSFCVPGSICMLIKAVRLWQTGKRPGKGLYREFPVVRLTSQAGCPT